MTRTKVPGRNVKGFHLDSALGIHQVISVDNQVKSLVEVGKPVTAWEVAVQTGSGHTEQVLYILDGLTARGVLARFRAGFVDYYALPKVALTGAEPTPGTIMADSLKSLFLSLRCKVTGKMTSQAT